ncbi:HIT family protein [Candidatus Woesearchaeota archaeon]|nr:HIT family protein [Candidatus Woesearchaeota archaeon]
MTDCIFCKIGTGIIPAARVYEDKTVMAFLDINPAAKGHTLVIPKNHYEKLSQIPEGELSLLMHGVQQVAKQMEKTLKPEGMNILVNVSKAAGQEVPHIHVHVIPRKQGDKVDLGWDHEQYEAGEIEIFKQKLVTRM